MLLACGDILDVSLLLFSAGPSSRESLAITTNQIHHKIVEFRRFLVRIDTHLICQVH